ncbi:MAG: kelch repeat-containing protein, partial [Eggerthella sp.]|nr:kelch repeat-containing protein [Eggerthella sp.]
LDWTPMGQTAVAALGKDRGWTTIAFDAQTLAQNAGGTLAFEGGKLQVRLTFARAGTPIAPTDALYLDTVGTGRAGSAIPYQSLSGTSMATPMVTGAAMVLAQDVDGSTPAERAAKLAALVKASVRPVDAFSGKCSSGGHLDLRVASGDFVPVVSGARMESDGDAALVMVEGSYFGAAQGAGSVHIGGKEAAVRSWSDGSIVTECPQGLKSGVLVVEVTAGNGKSGSKGFLLQVPERPDDQSTPLFEKTIALPTSDEGLPVGVSYGLLTGLGGSLYLLPNDFSISHAGTYALWRYDPDQDSWTQCADLPEALSSASMTVFDGKLYVYGEAGETDGALAPRLVSYDPATNAWTSHDASRLPFHATIVNCDGAMLLVGGAAYDGVKWVELTEGNIAVYDTQTGGGNGCGIPRDRPLDSLCRSARGRAVRRLGRCARRDGLFDDEPRIRAHREIRRLVRWQRPVRRPACACARLRRFVRLGSGQSRSGAVGPYQRRRSRRRTRARSGHLSVGLGERRQKFPRHRQARLPGAAVLPELDSVRRMAVHHGLLGLRERWPGDTGHADGDAAPTRRPT